MTCLVKLANPQLMSKTETQSTSRTAIKSTSNNESPKSIKWQAEFVKLWLADAYSSGSKCSDLEASGRQRDAIEKVPISCHSGDITEDPKQRKVSLTRFENMHRNASFTPAARMCGLTPVRFVCTGGSERMICIYRAF